MELRHLRYFVAVAEERHITRAAERLGIAQPPLSRQIRSLESELGVQLLTRVPHGVELTRGGAAFLDEARAILASANRAVTRASRVAAGLEGALSLGFTSSTVLHPIIAKALRAFRTASPAVTLDVEEGNAADLTEVVSEGRLDAAILRAPVAQPRGIMFHLLLEEKLVVVLPRTHRLAVTWSRRGVTLPALRDEPFILVRRPGGPGMYSNLIDACRRAGFEPMVAAEVTHMFTNLALVAAGIGISVVPACMRSVHSDGLVFCKLKDAADLVAPMTLLHRERNDNPALSQFVTLLRRLS